MKQLKISVLLMACLLTGGAFAYDQQGGPPGGMQGGMQGGGGQGGQGGMQGGGGHRPPGPPAEFLTACKGLAAGARAQVKSPRGDTMSGTCQLMFVPDHRAGEQQGQGGGGGMPPRQ
jgi:hypothetical protein